MTRNFGLVFFLILAQFFTAGCHKRTAEVPHEEEGHGKVYLKKEVQDSIGLSVTPVQRKKIISYLEVYGTIAQDTENTTHILSDAPGILKSFKAVEGDTVEEKAPIAVIETQNNGIREIFSPAHGIVVARYVKEGERVDALTSIATISNPDLLRASFDLYEKDLARVRLGQKTIVTSAAYPGKKFTGKVVFISPRVDDVTRTVKIRADIENAEHLLKFGMFVTGKIAGESEQEFLAVPQEAVQTLDGSKAVFVRTSADVFETREIKTGLETVEEAAVLEGLKEGEEIAVKGSFILKSELMKEELGEEGHSHA